MSEGRIAHHAFLHVAVSLQIVERRIVLFVLDVLMLFAGARATIAFRSARLGVLFISQRIACLPLAGGARRRRRAFVIGADEQSAALVQALHSDLSPACGLGGSWMVISPGRE